VRRLFELEDFGASEAVDRFPDTGAGAGRSSRRDRTVQKVTTCLCFDGQTEEAARCNEYQRATTERR